MKFISKVILMLLVSVVSWLAVTVLFPLSPASLDPNEWWGPEEARSKQNNSIRPFKIEFSEEMISDLKARLQNHRPLTPALEGTAFTYGFNSGRLVWWAQHWAERYPFRQREQLLNTYPQYITNVQGLDIHFIRVKPHVPKGVTVVPILMLHGWPLSVREFYEVIPLLTKQTEDYDFVFEIIAPSLPGFGFSDAAGRVGLGPYQMAVVFKNLMNRLGYKKFYIQGGDWGAVIARAMATYFEEDILGHYSNMLYVLNEYSVIRTILGTIFPSLIVEPHLASRMYPLSSYISFLIEETGYFHLQATKPDTVETEGFVCAIMDEVIKTNDYQKYIMKYGTPDICRACHKPGASIRHIVSGCSHLANGIGLSESPLGLLAYTFEKISVGTNRSYKHLDDGGLTLSYTKEQLLDNLMIYWMTNSITTSLRIYSEYLSNSNILMAIDKHYSSVPTWGLQTKNEIIYQPPNILKLKYTNLLGVTVLDNGGHYAALEMPKEFAEDVFKAVAAFRKFNKNKIEL